MIDFKAIETFMTVARLASFRKAADHLHTTQPAVSQRIIRLEEEIGARLLERDRRTVRPTPQGRALLEYGERLVRLRSEMLAAVGGAAAVSGLIRIGASETIVHTWLSQLIRRANEAFPRLSLEIEVDISPRLLERLRDGALDLAFMVGPVSIPEVRSVQIAEYPVNFVASRHIKWSRKVVPLKELASWPIVTFSRGTKPFEIVRDLFANAGHPAARLHASASLATVVKMALEGISIAAIPPVIVADKLRRGSLQLVPCASALPRLRFDAAWRSDSTDTAVPALVAIAAELGRRRARPQAGTSQRTPKIGRFR
jgi:DNA-binding transcriptional LysR family regulator